MGIRVARTTTSPIRCQPTSDQSVQARSRSRETFTVTQPGAFTDPTLTEGTTFIKAVHITDLRTRINLLRVGCDVRVFNFGNPTLVAGSTTAKGLHITELRTALGEAYVAGGAAAPTYTDPTLTTGSTVIKAVHITELRAAVIALE